MATCPFLDRECLKDACQLWAPGIGNCCFVASTILTEDLQRLGVVAYDRFLKLPEKPAASPAAKAGEPAAKPGDAASSKAEHKADHKKTPPPSPKG
jgi:hypothetical protein